MEKKEENKIEFNPVPKKEPLPESVSPVKNIDDLKELIEKNIKWSQVIYKQNKAIKNRLTLMMIGGYIKLLIVLIPIIIALIYLPPLFKDLFDQYKSLLGPVNISTDDLKNINIGDLLKSVSGQ